MKPLKNESDAPSSLSIRGLGSDPNSSDPSSSASISGSPSNPKSKIKKRKSSKRQRTGNVARLPKKTRDAICQMIQDGVPYSEMLSELGDAAVGISPNNLSEWKKGGYQDWLEEQRWTREMASLREGASGLLLDCDQLKIHQAAIQLAVIQIFQSLKHEKFNDDPQNYTRMLNTLSRLSREALVFTKYRELQRPDYYNKGEDDDDDQDEDPLSLAHEALLSALRPFQRANAPSSGPVPDSGPTPSHPSPSIAATSVQTPAPSETTAADNKTNDEPDLPNLAPFHSSGSEPELAPLASLSVSDTPPAASLAPVTQTSSPMLDAGPSDAQRPSTPTSALPDTPSPRLPSPLTGRKLGEGCGLPVKVSRLSHISRLHNSILTLRREFPPIRIKPVHSRFHSYQSRASDFLRISSFVIRNLASVLAVFSSNKILLNA